jgi:hypothetical protein
MLVVEQQEFSFITGQSEYAYDQLGKSYLLHDSSFLTFWKRQNYKHSKKKKKSHYQRNG